MLVRMGASRSQSGFASFEMERVAIASANASPESACGTSAMSGVWAGASMSFVFTSARAIGCTSVARRMPW